MRHPRAVSPVWLRGQGYPQSRATSGDDVSGGGHERGHQTHREGARLEADDPAETASAEGSLGVSRPVWTRSRTSNLCAEVRLPPGPLGFPRLQLGGARIARCLVTGDSVAVRIESVRIGADDPHLPANSEIAKIVTTQIRGWRGNARSRIARVACRDRWPECRSLRSVVEEVLDLSGEDDHSEDEDDGDAREDEPVLDGALTLIASKASFHRARPNDTSSNAEEPDG